MFVEVIQRHYLLIRRNKSSMARSGVNCDSFLCRGILGVSRCTGTNCRRKKMYTSIMISILVEIVGISPSLVSSGLQNLFISSLVYDNLVGETSIEKRNLSLVYLW